MAALSPDSLQVLSLIPPSAANPSLHTTFRSCAPQILKQSASLSIALKKGNTEVFLDRIPHRDLSEQGDGTLLATIPNVPIFANPQAGYTQVLMYAWNGEKFLGKWDVGRY